MVKRIVQKKCVKYQTKKKIKDVQIILKVFFKDLRKKIDYVKKEGKDIIMEIMKVYENKNNFLTKLNK